MNWIRGCALSMALAATACSGSVAHIDAAPPADAGVVPDSAGGADAAPTPDATPPATGMDIHGAGGRATGSTYTLDFEIGLPLDQGRATGGSFTIEGGAAVKP